MNAEKTKRSNISAIIASLRFNWFIYPNAVLMLCELCNKDQAMVHYTMLDREARDVRAEPVETKHHFCVACAHDFFQKTPGLGILNNLIRKTR